MYIMTETYQTICWAKSNMWLLIRHSKTEGQWCTWWVKLTKPSAQPMATWLLMRHGKTERQWFTWWLKLTKPSAEPIATCGCWWDMARLRDSDVHDGWNLPNHLLSQWQHGCWRDMARLWDNMMTETYLTICWANSNICLLMRHGKTEGQWCTWWLKLTKPSAEPIATCGCWRDMARLRDSDVHDDWNLPSHLLSQWQRGCWWDMARLRDSDVHDDWNLPSHLLSQWQRGCWWDMARLRDSDVHDNWNLPNHLLSQWQHGCWWDMARLRDSDVHDDWNLPNHLLSQ